MVIFNSYVKLPEVYEPPVSKFHANPAKAPERFLGRQGQVGSIMIQ